MIKKIIINFNIYMSILVGRADIYDIDICNKQPTFHYHMTRSITTITADLVQIIKDLCIKLLNQILLK